MFKRFLSAAKRAAQSVDDKKASDILLLDVRKVSGVADYYVLCSVDSSVQMSATTGYVARVLREEFNLRPLHSDGRRSEHWAALDFGGLVVHVLHRQAREFYALERLWEGARRLKWEEAPAVRKPSRRRSAQ